MEEMQCFIGKNGILKVHPCSESCVKFLVKTNDLFEWSAFRNCIWTKVESPLTRTEIEDSLNKGRFENTPFDCKFDEWNREDHVKRIAWLVNEKREKQDFFPIVIETGIKNLGYVPEWPIQDGNHRIAAAIFREDEKVVVEFFGDQPA